MKKTEFKCVIIGDPGIGKTSLLTTFSQGYFPENHYSPTIFPIQLTGGNIFCKNSVIEYKGRPYSLLLWDTAGTTRKGGDNQRVSLVGKGKTLRTSVYDDADLFIFCFSLVNRESYNNVIKKWVKEIKDQGKKNIPKMLVGLKSDLWLVDDDYQEDDYFDKFVSRQEGEKLKKKIGAVAYRECSSKESVNVSEIFELCLKAIVRSKSSSSSSRKRFGFFGCLKREESINEDVRMFESRELVC